MTEKPRYYSYLRFSSAEQEYGDSIRRQTALAEKWAQENGVILDDSLKMEDRGLSAFHQRHLGKNAALGAFLQAIADGKVPRGSVLLVESMDRLSRASVKDAQVQFMQILQAGVDIVTLSDGHRFSWDTLDELQLILSIFVQSRAHEESKRKSQRVAAAWSAKHEIARQTKKPITRKIPAWLRLEEDGFHVIEERAVIIRRIFREVLDGDGVEMITRRLNQEGIPPWGTPHKLNRDKVIPVWNKSYVVKILKEGQVTGRYVPSTLKDGKRTPQEGIENFYPTVISKEVFRQAAEAMKARTLGAGRVGRISNLFPHLCRCGYCGQPAQHINKGKGQKTGFGEYLVCGQARVGKGCEYHGLPYLQFEEAFLRYCQEVDLSALMERDTRAEAIKQAQAELDAINGGLVELQEKISGLLATIPAIKNPAMAQRLASDLDATEAEHEALQQQRDKALSQLNALQKTGQTVADHVESIQDLNRHLENCDEAERIRIRKNLKHAIARAVEKIEIYPDGLKDRIVAYDPKTGITIKPFTGEPTSNAIEQTVLVEHVANNIGRRKACVLLQFRNGHSRLFRWDADNKRFILDSEDTSDSLIIAGLDFGTLPKADIKLPETPGRREKVNRFVDHITRKK